MTAPPEVLGLYFYRAAHPVAGPDADFNDARYYVARSQTTYIKLDTKTSVVRRSNPVLLAFRDLVKLAPHGIGSRWPKDLDIGTAKRPAPKKSC
ncbi:MAG: hypothetical protein R3B70_35585 [Polyangiaceae bacterium]